MLITRLPRQSNQDKVKVALYWSNCATKKQLNDVTGVNTSNVAAKKNKLFKKLKLTSEILIN